MCIVLMKMSIFYSTLALKISKNGQKLSLSLYLNNAMQVVVALTMYCTYIHAPDMYMYNITIVY